MSDFKSYIKERYNQEVQPQYTDEAWHKFAAAAQLKPEKKSRKWLLFLFALLLGVTFSSMYFLNSGENNISVAESKANYTEQHTGSITLQDTKKETRSDDIVAIEKETNAIGEDKDILDRQDENKPNDQSSVPLITGDIVSIDNDNNQVTKEYTGTTGYHSSLPPPEADPVVNESELTKENNSFIVPGEVIEERMVPLSFVSLDQIERMVLNEEDYFFQNRKIIPVSRSEFQGFWVIGIDAGVGRSYHRSINDQGVYMMSGILGFSLSNHIKIKATAGLLQSRYSSRVLNRSLGLRSINYPVREARLDKVNSTTTYVETGIGVDYMSPSFRKFNISVGPGLLFVKEISRKLDYSFNQGDMDLESVNVAVDEHPTHPVNLTLNVGVNYQLNPDLLISLKGEYLKALKNSEIELPRQARIKVGIEKKL